MIILPVLPLFFAGDNYLTYVFLCIVSFGLLFALFHVFRRDA